MSHISAAVENEEQLRAVLKCKAAELCFIDSGFFSTEKFPDYVRAAHEQNIKLGLRLPQLWRDKAEVFFIENAELIKKAGFDLFLFRNLEGLLSLKALGLTDSTPYLLDHTVYIFNRDSFAELIDMLKTADCIEGLKGITLSLELNMHELKRLAADIRNIKKDVHTELTVYGRAPMMVSSQCVKKTVSGCDKRTELLFLKDRKDALMPSENICRFCYGVIYNSVPTAIYDLKGEIRDIAPDSIRYEFTIENGKEVLDVLGSERPAEGGFTRGHFRRSVE